MSDQRLDKRLTIPITAKMEEDINVLGLRLGLRAVDLGRMALTNLLERYAYLSICDPPAKREDEDEPHTA